MDDYFVNRVDTPKDENGEYDFETVKAVDLPFFQQQMHELLDGTEVALPTYDFTKGERVFKGNKLKLQKDSVLVIEGLHALNPCVLPDVDKSLTFKIFVSALTTINIDNHNWIPTTDIRLLRRVVRDYKYRGFSAKRDDRPLPVRHTRRDEMGLSFPGRSGCHVQLRPDLRVRGAQTPCRTDPPRGA